MRRPEPERARQDETAVLIYELLDAHYDTAEMAAELASDPAWRAHLEYLRALQCKGREVLAQLATEPDGP
jgi:hypothetical protein